jgi:Skp family chaperone for outer membrane proteins
MKRQILLLFIILLSLYASAQTSDSKKPDPAIMDRGSISEQFDYVKKKSSNFEEYKVIKRVLLNKLQKHILDSLNGYKKNISDLRSEIHKQEQAYEELQSKLDETNKLLEESNKSIENIDFIGMQINKKSFKSIFWTITLLLSLLLAYFIYRFKNSNKVTANTLKELSELEEEFNAHRSRALEREQVLNRKLQDEINRNKGKA